MCLSIWLGTFLKFKQMKEGEKLTIEKELSGTVSESKLKLLKAQHKDVKIIEVDMEDGEIAVAYFKVPGLQIYSIVMSTVEISTDGTFKIKDFERFKNVIIENCWLDGDKRIKEDEMLAFSVSQQLFSLVRVKASRIKNA